MEAPTIDPAPVVTTRSLALTAAALAGATVVVAILCSLLGEAELTWYIWTTRITRLAMAAAVGAGLASAGMSLQGMLRNPLAEPYILGVSSGAGVGVLLGLSLARRAILPAWAGTPLLALAGALLTSAVVYGIAQRRGKLDPYSLLLSGVIINAFNGAVMLTIYLFVERYVVSDYLSWAIGSLNVTDTMRLRLLPVGGVLIIGGWAVLLLRGSALNALGLGDDVASSSGVAVHWLRVETFVVVALMTAAAVSLAGPIGFVGLIVPHICRLMVGADHRRLVIVSGFAGAILLMSADTLCRSAGVFLPRVGDVPVGILTALAGGPFFIYLLRRRLRENAS